MLSRYKIVDLDSGETCENKQLLNADFAPNAYTKRDIEVLLMTLRDLESMQKLLRVFHASRHMDMYTLCQADRTFTCDASTYTHAVSDSPSRQSRFVTVQHCQTLYFVAHNPLHAHVDTKEEKELQDIEQRLPGLNAGTMLLTKLNIDIELPENIILHDAKNVPTNETPINFVVTFSTKEQPGKIRKCVLSVEIRGIFIRDSDISFEYDACRHVVVAKFIHDSAAIIAQQSHMCVKSVEYSDSDHIYHPFPCRTHVEYMQLPPDMEETLRLFLQKKIDLTVIGDMCCVEKMTGNCATTMYRMTDANRIYINKSISAVMADAKFAVMHVFNAANFNVLFPQDEDPEEVEVDEDGDENALIPGIKTIYTDRQAFIEQHRGTYFAATYELTSPYTLINVEHQRYLDEWARAVRDLPSSEPDRTVAFRYKFCYD